ncbi:MAG TPA: phage protease [Candidatus Competibacteraceae bacterium]|nr:phage protease [Candidatus Competibacteraceae bacterium]
MLTIALNTPLPATASAAPTWIQLLPDSRDITGYDGRRWRNDLPDRVVAQSRMPLVLDYEHASEHRAPQGLDAPAAGWIARLEVRGGAAVWGQVDWTERARQQIEAREYRFLSPVFQYEKDSQRIVRLTSAGLTNQPNLPLTALNRKGTPAMLSTTNRASASADPLARFAPVHRAQIERLKADNHRLTTNEAIDRFLAAQRAQSALALSREKGLSYGQAWQKLETDAFYAAR